MPTKQKTPVVYVAGPYRAATRELITENIAVARSVAVATARLGWFPLCPHTNTAHFDDDLPGQDEFFLDGTLALMERCDAVVLINGWRYSSGTLGEVHRARELGIPIFACLEDLPAAQEFAEQPSREPFQARVKPWLLECFGEVIAADRQERNHRLLEEALELVQACGCTETEARQLVDYVYGRPAGEPSQEVGGVMVTLAALCLAAGLDMHAAGEIELARIWTKVDQIRAKQAAKPSMSPLPGAYPDREQHAPVAVVPELTSELRWILGQMCFQHIHTAQALRLMGHQIARKAEDEQAVTIYWMLGHYLKDPKNWRENATAEMKAAAPAA